MEPPPVFERLGTRRTDLKRASRKPYDLDGLRRMFSAAFQGCEAAAILH